jgi:hypothetical protein
MFAAMLERESILTVNETALGSNLDPVGSTPISRIMRSSSRGRRPSSSVNIFFCLSPAAAFHLFAVKDLFFKERCRQRLKLIGILLQQGLCLGVCLVNYRLDLLVDDPGVSSL